MKKKLLFIAMATIVLASCSQEEIVEVSKGKAISFRATTEYMSRGTAVTEEQNIGGGFFNVTARLKNNSAYSAVYFSGQTWKYENSQWITDNPPYWPNEGNLGFFAYAPTSVSNIVSEDENDTSLKDFSPKLNVKEQDDLMVARNLSANDNGSPVGLTFRHALSQIEVKARVHNANFTVNIKGIKLANIVSKGNLNEVFNSAQDYNFTFGGNGANQGEWSPTWTIDKTKTDTYAISGDAVPLKATDTDASFLKFDAGSFMLLPQELAVDLEATADEYEGAYIGVLCNIVQKNLGQTTETQIFPSTEVDSKNEGKYAYRMIPISGTWEAGKKYTYTLNFFQNGGGAGAADPYPGDGFVDENGNPTVDENGNPIVPTDVVSDPKELYKDNNTEKTIIGRVVNVNVNSIAGFTDGEKAETNPPLNL